MGKDMPMASATYEQILQEVERLTSEEQHRLLQALAYQSGTVQDTLSMLRERSAHPIPLTEDERKAAQEWLDRVDALADRISVAWDDPKVSAVEAVREQRREL